MDVKVGFKLQHQKTSGAWRMFLPGVWQDRINLRDFIQHNHTPFEGDGSFLAGPTERTKALWQKLVPMIAEEREKGVLDVSQVPSSIVAHAPGYLDKDNEIIVGLQTEAPLKRAIMPFGGWRVVEAGLKAYGYTPDPLLSEIFSKYRKTHNDGVFDAYTPAIRRARSSHIVTGLPDAYGRGRIIVDYRRVALYGVDFLINDKEREKADLNLLDIKSGDPAIYEKVTRHPLQPTLDYAKRLSDLGRPTWVRFVLAPGLTDSWDNVEKVADIAAGIKSLERVEILRFHQMGRDKWHKLGLECLLENVAPPEPELTERVRGQFRSRGLTVY